MGTDFWPPLYLLRFKLVIRTTRAPSRFTINGLIFSLRNTIHLVIRCKTAARLRLVAKVVKRQCAVGIVTWYNIHHREHYHPSFRVTTFSSTLWITKLSVLLAVICIVISWWMIFVKFLKLARAAFTSGSLKELRARTEIDVPNKRRLLPKEKHFKVTCPKLFQ